MSHTTIYFLSGENTVTEDFRNAFRGAMYVWNDVAKRYCGMERFPFFDEDEQMEVWNFNSRHPGRMSRHEEIVLLSTMDHVLAEPARWQEVADAFELYGKEHPDSSIAEQSAAIRRVMESEAGAAVAGIGWLQTSVCGDTPWMPWDEDGEEYIAYDPVTGDTHWWLMGQMDAAEEHRDD
ncbi:MAG: hypothetical protein Q7Q73_05800 [Verrucomicrobiota bacterium JB024]|nr:hypothetical protein [Verrucomicrobiota bacterium JB024]